MSIPGSIIGYKFLSMLSPIGVKLLSFSPKFPLSLFLVDSAIFEIYISLTNVFLLWQIVRILGEGGQLRSFLFGYNFAVGSTDEIGMQCIVLL